MTTEEKAKKYDETLEWMKKVYPTLSGAAKEDAEHYFPELKEESEDERIRKELISYLNEMKNCGGVVSFNGFSIEEYITYLEKQKEQTFESVWHKEECQQIIDEGQGLTPRFKDLFKEVCKAFYEAGARWQEKQKKQKSVECIKFNNEFENQISHLIASVLNGEHEYNEGFVKYVAQSLLGYASKEQKPAEWSEEDKAIIGCIVCCLDGQFVTETARKQCLEWFNKHRRDFLNQPKQEWNEEDKRKLNRIYEILGHAADDNGFLTSKRIIGDNEAIELQDFLKSLRSQTKQKWSEEDKHRCKDAIYFLETAKKHYADTSEIELTIKWLKSLRFPLHLKPSDALILYKEQCRIIEHSLATGFMNYLDNNKPEGKMCLSNGECEDIDKAFKENDWAKIIRYTEKYQAQSEQKLEVKHIGWVARDSEHNPYFGLGLVLFKAKPKRSGDCWTGVIDSQLPWNLFPDLKWEDEPIEVEVTIKRK